MTPLNESALHQAAMTCTGLSDFGDPAYLTGLRVGLEAVARRSPSEKLNELFAARSLRALVGRLHSQASWQKHPEYRDTRIIAPIMITGMSRSGTSALHQLLAVDEQFQWMPHWIAQAPTVRRPRSEWPSDPAYWTMAAAVKAQHHSNPALRAAHNIEVELPEECINVMCQSFVSMTFVPNIPLPHYYQWLLKQDETPSYRRYADNLRLIGAATPPERPWLLKNPSHTFGMAALLKVFPDARIIVTHRDPVAAISSAASLTHIISAELWEPGEAGRHRMEVSACNIERLQAARDSHPDRFHDVDYRALVADPMGVVQGIYRRFQLTLSAAAASAMKKWIEQNPQGKFGQHRYTPKELGVNENLIRSRFADYIRRYHLDQPFSPSDHVSLR
jgi:hypothetical protein